MDKDAGAVSELVDQLGRLPGVGRKSAERLAFHLLRVPEGEAIALADAIRRIRSDVRLEGGKELFRGILRGSFVRME